MAIGTISKQKSGRSRMLYDIGDCHGSGVDLVLLQGECEVLNVICLIKKIDSLRE